jgi:hypothetical protein
MRSVRETYDLPKHPPLPFRQIALMLVIPALALGLWLVLPDSPITVALLAVSIFAAVFGGVTLVLRSRRTSEAPGRHPITPPSVDP